MHEYFEKRVELMNAEEDFKSSIERITNECSLDIYIKISTDMPVVTLWDETTKVMIHAAGVTKPILTRKDMPLDERWSKFIHELKCLVEHS